MSSPLSPAALPGIDRAMPLHRSPVQRRLVAFPTSSGCWQAWGASPISMSVVSLSAVPISGGTYEPAEPAGRAPSARPDCSTMSAPPPSRRGRGSRHPIAATGLPAGPVFGMAARLSRVRTRNTAPGDRRRGAVRCFRQGESRRGRFSDGPRRLSGWGLECQSVGPPGPQASGVFNGLQSFSRPARPVGAGRGGAAGRGREGRPWPWRHRRRAPWPCRGRHR